MGVLFCLLGGLLGAAVGLSSAFMLSSVIAGDDFLIGGAIFLFAAPLGLIIGAGTGASLARRARRSLSRDGGTRLQRFLPLVGICLGLPALAAALLWISSLSNRPPSDAQLIDNFRRHQRHFAQLTHMVQTDRYLTRVDDDWTAPDDPKTIGVSQARISEYRHLLREAGTPRGFQSMDKADEIEFYYWLRGSATSSDTEKGYAFLTKPPSHILPSLDGCGRDEKNGVEAYHHIEGHWYLFYDYIPG